MEKDQHKQIWKHETCQIWERANRFVYLEYRGWPEIWFKNWRREKGCCIRSLYITKEFECNPGGSEAD